MNKDFGEIGEIDKTIGKYSFKRLFARLRLFLANTISNNLLPKHFMHALKLRAWVYRRIGGLKIGRGVRMYGGTIILGNSVRIGDGTFINADCLFTGNEECVIGIGSNCDISHGVHFVCGSHNIGSSTRRAGEGECKPISVGDGVWIGCRSTLLGGVRIGNGVVVGAASLVNKDVSENLVVGGMPAKVIKKLES